MAKDTVNTSVRLPLELIEWLDEKASEIFSNRASIIRQAVAEMRSRDSKVVNVFIGEQQVSGPVTQHLAGQATMPLLKMGETK